MITLDRDCALPYRWTISEATLLRKNAPQALVLYNICSATPHDPAADESAEVPADVAAVSDALRGAGFTTAAVNIENDVERIVSALAVHRPILVFNLVDQLGGDTTRAASVAGLLDLWGYPYIGSDPLCVATCQNRVRTRLLLHDAGIPVPRFAVVRDVNAIPDTSHFRHPLVVTQAFDDVYREEGQRHPIQTRQQLLDHVSTLTREFDFPLLIEEYVGAHRIHAIVLGNRVLELLPLTESQPMPISSLTEVAFEMKALSAPPPDPPASGDAPGDDRERHPSAAAAKAADPGPGDAAAGDDPFDPSVILAAERADTDEHQLPAQPVEAMLRLAQLDEEITHEIRGLARRAFRVMQCRDIAQIDFHLDQTGAPVVVDVRPMVEFDTDTPFFVAAESSDRGHAETVAHVANIAGQRAGLLRLRPGEDEEERKPSAGENATPDGDDPKAGAPATPMQRRG